MISSRLAADLDRPLVVITFLLAVIGIAFVYSATVHTEGALGPNLYVRQLIWLGIAIGAGIVTAAVPYRVYHGKTAWLLYVVALLLLVLTLAVGRSGLGAQRWLGWGPFRFQPSELAKVAVVILLANVLSVRKIDLTQFRTLLKPLLLTVIPVILVLRQPDLGTSLAFLAVLFTMLYWAGIPLLTLFLLLTPIINVTASFYWPAWVVFAAGLALVLYRSRLGLLSLLFIVLVNLVVGIVTPQAWGHLEPYQRQRITTFLNPGTDPYGSGYQIIQSKIALGSGQVTGKGFLHGTQKGLAFLPEQHTDFIYSVVGEETGFLGAGTVLVLYLLLILRGLRVARHARNRFAGLIAIGLTAVFLYHVLVNVCMTVGLAPVTGLPLPLLSYGGTSLVTSFLQIGFIQNVAMRWREY